MGYAGSCLRSQRSIPSTNWGDGHCSLRHSQICFGHCSLQACPFILQKGQWQGLAALRYLFFYVSLFADTNCDFSFIGLTRNSLRLLQPWRRPLRVSVLGRSFSSLSPRDRYVLGRCDKQFLGSRTLTYVSAHATGLWSSWQLWILCWFERYCAVLHLLFLAGDQGA